jgi:hypothetical protein
MEKKNFRKMAKGIVSHHTTHGLSRSEAKFQNRISSLGTERNYVQALTAYLEWCGFNDVQPDFFSNVKFLITYLEERSESVRQKTLNQERQALQLIYMQALPFIFSKLVTVAAKRSYSKSQVDSILTYQSDRNLLTTRLGFECGLRAHEPATILPLAEQPPSSHRSWDCRIFLGFPEHHIFTVIGKGGLRRCVAVPIELANQLDSRRIPPIKVKDRGIFYVSNYDLGFGQSFSQSFSTASKKALGFSTGAHGLRHSYTKMRLLRLIDMLNLQSPEIGKEQIRKEAMSILSQELGHFRTDILYYYLR